MPVFIAEVKHRDEDSPRRCPHTYKTRGAARAALTRLKKTWPEYTPPAEWMEPREIGDSPPAPQDLIAIRQAFEDACRYLRRAEEGLDRIRKGSPGRYAQILAAWDDMSGFEKPRSAGEGLALSPGLWAVSVQARIEAETREILERYAPRRKRIRT